MSPPNSQPALETSSSLDFRKLTEFFNFFSKSSPSMVQRQVTASAGASSSALPLSGEFEHVTPLRKSTNQEIHLNPSASTKNPTDFVAHIFEEHKNSHAILYSKFEDPYANETAETFAKEPQRGRPTTYRYYPNVPLNKPGCSPTHSEIFNIVSVPNDVASPSSTFRSNATDFLRKFNSEDLTKEPATGDMVGIYQLGEVIGMGAFSTVREGSLPDDPFRKFAIKIQDKNSCDEQFLQTIYHEISIWKTLNHPNIVQFRDVIETPRYIFVVCDLCKDGRLYDLVINSQEGFLPEEQAKSIFRQLVDVLHYLHSNGISHGDIKLDNILLDGKDIKLCDFGFSDYLEAGQKKSRELQPCGGTLLYCAPEVLKGSQEIGAASDVWSTGVTLFAMVTGELPFDDDYEPRLKHMILSGKFCFPSDSVISQELRDLISKMLKVKCSERLTIADIRNHPWLH